MPFTFKSSVLLLLVRLSSSACAPPSPSNNPVYPDSHPSTLCAFPPKERIFEQRVDHFRTGQGTGTFKQRYLLYDNFFEKCTRKNCPILFYLGGEGQIEGFYKVTSVLFSSIGPALGGLIVFVEHRDYGKSTVIERSGHAEDLRFLSVDQALADFAVFITSYKNSILRKPDTPVLLFGGSYGGMLVAWFRVKYPHLSNGGVVSSGPVDFNVAQKPQERFWAATLHTFRRMGGESCVNTVQGGLEDLGSKNFDSQQLQKLFGTCTAPSDTRAMRRALALYIRGALASLAMVNYPYAHTLVTPLPALPVKVACERFLNPGDLGSSSELRRLAALNSTVNLYVRKDLPCKGIEKELVVFEQSAKTEPITVAVAANSGTETEGLLAGRTVHSDVLDMEHWNRQACTEIPLQGLTTDFLGFYPTDDESLGELFAACQARYGVRPDTGVDGGVDLLALRYGLGVAAEAGKPSLRLCEDPPGTSDLQRSGLTRVVVVDGEFDPWNVGALPPPKDCMPLNATTGPACRDEKLDVTFILPVRSAAHHQDLVAEHVGDSEELRAARALILEQLRRWAALGPEPASESSVESDGGFSWPSRETPGVFWVSAHFPAVMTLPLVVCLGAAAALMYILASTFSACSRGSRRCSASHVSATC